MRNEIWLKLALVGTLSLCPLAARAEAAGATLSQAKRAYAEVDYEKTRQLAAESLRRGGNDRQTTEELYWLWATAAAALDQTEEATSAFVHALAQNPELKLDRNLSPKIRAPYLEARGKLGTTNGRAPLDITLQLRHEQLEITLHDALEVAGGIELGTRELGEKAFTRQKLPNSPVQQLPKPRGSSMAFFVRVLDRFGNVLIELGTAADPRRLALVRSSKPQAAAASPNRSSDRSVTPYYVVSGSLAALGLAAGGVATAMYVRREDAASDWNSDACEQPGLSRAQQCRDVNDRRERAENLAIGLTATGGALLVGSVVSLLLAPSSTEQPKVGLSAGPYGAWLSLQGSM